MRFEYAAAPEARSLVALRDSYGLFIGGSFAGGASVFKTISPSTEEVLAEVTHGATETWTAVKLVARQAYARAGLVGDAGAGAVPVGLFADRAADPGAGGRSSAVLDTLDGGRPIRQTRDVDAPLAAAHFFYHAPRADKLGYADSGRSPRLLGVVGQIVFLELALAHARLAARARPGLREYRHPEAVGGQRR